MHVLTAMARPTPPLFFGGVEVGNAILGEELVATGHQASFLGSYTHPRWNDDRLLGQHLTRLRNQGCPVAITGQPAPQVFYRWNGVSCCMGSTNSLLVELAHQLQDA